MIFVALFINFLIGALMTIPIKVMVNILNIKDYKIGIEKRIEKKIDSIRKKERGEELKNLENLYRYKCYILMKKNREKYGYIEDKKFMLNVNTSFSSVEKYKLYVEDYPNFDKYATDVCGISDFIGK